MTTTEKSAQPPRGSGRPSPRDRILSAAAGLFYVEGINATGVELIASEAGVSKRTLYKYFPSKVTLVEQYLAYLREMVVDPRGGQADGPRERLMRLFTIPEPGDGRLRGCPFHNAAVEAASAMPEVTEFVHTQKRAFATAIVDLCRDYGASDPSLLGHQIALLYEGAAALSTSLDDVEPWAYARTTVEMLLDHARPDARATASAAARA
ncbi:TetR/AcrR family transcriptional regulator [Gordonia sp. KTR9]|uniref:TetR/AcrR family transcriptional regulator n=1 Tax=Gordonia sp. KTR9 TaxID=337191 RepID=UPI00027DE1E3|nr:TetR/AcrR family transcriptional regulator [Gordonia sp. KTR9]AFR50752.1 Transcriptional regulator [Gordonia sp. KTR9]